MQEARVLEGIYRTRVQMIDRTFQLLPPLSPAVTKPSGTTNFI